VPNLIHLAIPGFLLLLAIEAICDAVMRRYLYEWRDTAASLTMGIGNVLIGLCTKGIAFAVYALAYKFAPWHLGFAWWVWLLAFVADDITYYWYHRTSHQCRLFWASHVVHHSSQKYNLGTALRQTWTGGFMGFIFWAWMPLVGFSPFMVLTMQAISLLYQFWIHTEIIRRMGHLELVMNTPSHHRVHHASNGRYLDRNHAGTLIIWDRLFGTFEQEIEKPVYGLTKNINSYNPLLIAFHEWKDIVRDARKSPDLRTAFKYIFGPPGWKPQAKAAVQL
jgi:sterol desaturase/sphingolipid hydroxylase (fatty acid hydroxylase superfamily)